ncbi:hypothetical protein KDW_39400 [Dictyobacter vulcani]|uniref:TIR domain-containing protein n=1 Tax=Dictyobacter vulcani TaxID=2607529 RepID=A0A5J4KJ88_9CHLR|nr:toll/interleukin-1 receptor domain-containing protein [Dictyobacter vulcani]GER89778.1 hypothetical protein KDW_39400 [Dictyobacter vulcani]
MSTDASHAVEVFISYAHEDEDFVKALDKHMSNLRRQKLISSWYDRDITAGDVWAEEIEARLNRAALILLLISSDFIYSDYCYDIEMARAMERAKRKEAHVIPVVVRPCDWKGTPFAGLQALPTRGKAVSTWSNRDEAFLDIVQGIRAVLNQL